MFQKQYTTYLLHIRVAETVLRLLYELSGLVDTAPNIKLIFLTPAATAINPLTLALSYGGTYE